MIKKINKTVLILAVAILFAIPRAWAIRPFITDDATLIGFKRAELASWFYGSKARTEFWHSANIGLTNWAELTVAGFWGRSKYEFLSEKFKEYSYTLPLLQAKFLLRDYTPNGLPGVTVAVGSDMPWGNGAYVPEGYNAFAFSSLTQCFGHDENVLIHAQIGTTYLRNRESRENFSGLVYGFGAQVKAYKGFHLIGEVVNGDPYEHGVGSMYQLGIRQFVNDDLQFDLAFGGGISGDTIASSWFTCGIRYVLSFNKQDKFALNGRKID
jgi:hypothetical protein